AAPAVSRCSCWPRGDPGKNATLEPEPVVRRLELRPRNRKHDSQAETARQVRACKPGWSSRHRRSEFGPLCTRIGGGREKARLRPRLLDTRYVAGMESSQLSPSRSRTSRISAS